MRSASRNSSSTTKTKTRTRSSPISRRRTRPKTLPLWPSRQNWSRRFGLCSPASKVRDGTAKLAIVEDEAGIKTLPVGCVAPGAPTSRPGEPPFLSSRTVLRDRLDPRAVNGTEQGGLGERRVAAEGAGVAAEVVDAGHESGEID